MSATSREILLSQLQTLFSFGGAQGLQTQFPRIENSSRGQPDVDQIVPVLPRENEVVFPAVEAAAQEWPAIINGAAVRSEVHASAPLVRGKSENRIAVDAVAQNLALVGFHVVPFVRMKDKPLIRLATFRAAIAGHVRRLVGQGRLNACPTTRHRLFPLSQKNLRLHAGAAAQHFHFDFLPRFVRTERVGEIVKVLNRIFSELHQNIARFQTGFRGRG
jgi:hypothetical protein